MERAEPEKLSPGLVSYSPYLFSLSHLARGGLTPEQLTSEGQLSYPSKALDFSCLLHAFKINYRMSKIDKPLENKETVIFLPEI